MKRRGLTVALCAINAALLALVVWQAWTLRSLHSAQRDDLASASTASAAPQGARVAPEPEKSVAASERALSAATASRTPPAFDWRRVESPDYRAYLQNLRAIGCPEQTVRDIVTADVVQNFAEKRRAAAAAAYRDFKYWDTGAADADRRAALAQERRALDTQMTDTLHTLLGADAPVPDLTRQWQNPVAEAQLAFLPDAQRAQALAVLNQYPESELQIPPAAGDRLASDQADDLQRRLEAFDQKRQQLQSLLTPEQWDQVELSVSWTADNLRHAMREFQPTPEEFRAIFHEWRAHDERVARCWAAGEPDPGNAGVFANLQSILGARYEEYRRTWWQ